MSNTRNEAIKQSLWNKERHTTLNKFYNFPMAGHISYFFRTVRVSRYVLYQVQNESSVSSYNISVVWVCLEKRPF